MALAPRLATRMMALVIRYLRSRGLRLAIYIDDMILLARSYKESIEQTQLLVDTLHTAQARLQHSSRQIPSNPLRISKIPWYTGELQADAMQSAEGQDHDSSRNSVSPLRKQQRHSHGTQVLQPPRQAKLGKWSGHLSPTSSPDEAAATSCHIHGWHASKLAGHRGDAVVAR